MLGELLRGGVSRSDLPKTTEVFQKLRKPRAEKVQRIAYAYRTLFTLPDGTQQEKRDVGMKKLREYEDNSFQHGVDQWMEKHDAIEEVTYSISRARKDGAKLC